MLKLLPSATLPITDSWTREPNRTIPWTETLLPILWCVRIDNEEPKAMLSKMEVADPTLQKLLRLMLEPKLTNSCTDV
jgi:hypothetical protein